MIIAYKYQSRAGLFAIRLFPDLRWHAFFEDEDVGNYDAPRKALGDLLGGHTFSASCGDTAKLGLPDELSEWTTLRV